MASAAAILVTEESLFHNFDDSPTRLVGLDRERHQISGCSDEDPKGEADPAQLALLLQADTPLPRRPEPPAITGVRTAPDSGALRQDGTAAFELGEGLTNSLKALAHLERTTLFITLLAGYQALLHRFSGQQDIAVAIPAANGIFANTLVVRTGFTGNPTVSEIIGRVRDVCLDGYANQDLRFEEQVDVVEPEQDKTEDPLSRVAFVFENASTDESAAESDRNSLSGIDRTTFDLILYIEESDGGLSATFLYNPALFEYNAVRRISKQFVSLITEMAENTGQAVAGLRLLGDSERHRMAVEWNDNRTPYPRAKCIHELFEEQVVLRPDAIAAVSGDAHISYRALNRRANSLSHDLREHGVCAEARVGVSIDRSIELVIALLGVLKAGGAYLPLDPAYPPARLLYMARDAEISVLLRRSSDTEPSVPGYHGDVLYIDSDGGLKDPQTEDAPLSGSSAESLAYVMYTSGSTGQPKGIAIPHRAITRLVCETNYIDLLPGDPISQVSNTSFDAATFEIWGGLLHGGRLIVIPQEIVLSPSGLADEFAKHGIRVAFLTTALFNQTAEYAPQTFSGLRELLTGGEAADPRRFQMVLDNQPPERLLHVYGPTESTTFATWELVQEVELDGRVPIGRAISNTQTYVVGEGMEPVPEDVAGELYIGGEGLARGYLNRAELTGEKFVPSPFEASEGARLYKTGDLVRAREDGRIEFIGRADDQVKIRGFRIELGEIEGVLRQYPGIQEALVVAGEDERGEKRLVAYLVGAEVKGLSAAAVRQFLKEKLPAYMAPSTYVMMEQLPLTANGKVDRKALPDPSWNSADVEYAGARTLTEEIVTGIWEEVLGVRQAGIKDVFFEAGGHSILAMRVMTRLRDAFHLDVPIQRIFDTPTIAGLSEAIDEALGNRQCLGDETASGCIPRIQDGTRIPASFAQQRLWFLDQLVPGNPAYNVPVCYRVTGPLNLIGLEQSIGEITRRHEVLRTTFQEDYGEPVQLIGSPEILRLRFADLSGLRTGERDTTLKYLEEQEARKPFDLQSEPVLRGLAIRLKENDSAISVTMHHIVSDGWSLAIFNEEASAIHRSFGIGEPGRLAELTTQFADYAVWERGWLESGVLDRELNYWTRQLADLPALALPIDRSRPPIQTFRGRTIGVDLGAELTACLKKLARQEGATLFMALLAAYQVLLQRYTGQDDIPVGIPIANRNRKETEKLIGFFVNTLIIRTDVAPAGTFRQVLRSVRDASIAAYANQNLPFDKLVEHLHPGRSAGSIPLIQAMFAFQTSSRSGLELESATVVEEEPETGTARFDLTLSMYQSAESLSASLVYSSDLFDPRTMEALLESLRALFDAAAASPDEPISRLPIVGRACEQQQLHEWNDSRELYPSRFPGDLAFQDLFARSVERTPDSIAAYYEGEHLTYSTLGLKANQLGNYLQKHGIGPEAVVGVCLERSPGMLLAILGILKAGGAYLPLDYELPGKRLKFMLEDSRARLTLTQSRLAPLMPDTGTPVICVDSDWGLIAQESGQTPVGGATAANLAYVIYTSGSTGQPKGSLITHRSLVNYLSWVNSVLIAGTGATLPAVTKLSFDASLKQLLAPLLRGEEVWLLPDNIAVQPDELVKRLAERENTGLNCVPSLWKAILDQADTGQISLPASLRSLFIGGEQVSSHLVASTAHRCPGLRIYNLYGPSEATANASIAELAAGDTITIGRPLANAKIHLLDRCFGLIPIGLPGELFIGGVGLARCYLNQAGLTAERFVPDPFGENPGAALYRSGDLARHLPDGKIEFLGRLDQQVKVHGFRIELGEIEAGLAAHGAVREAAVLVSEDEPGGKRLAAFLVGRGLERPGSTELRRHLRERLPDYMIPDVFTWLDEMPLMPNGKLDRPALAKRGLYPHDLEAGYVAPRSDFEEMMAAIWSDVLGVDQVGVHDDFFALGGHSIRAMMVVSRLREAFQADLPLHLLFVAPTVAELTVAVVQNISRQQGGLEQSVPCNGS
ncbi:MAG TPA: amino acid adenylation domain-containing protein [Blastocatellia bacterium]|nr:amino acid adenylation domain-containing protein [Blastocatellia bacterium]